MLILSILFSAPAEAACVPPLPVNPTKPQLLACVASLEGQLVTANANVTIANQQRDAANAALAVAHANESAALTSLATCETSLANATATCAADTAVKNGLQTFLDAAAVAGVIIPDAPAP